MKVRSAKLAVFIGTLLYFCCTSKTLTAQCPTGTVFPGAQDTALTLATAGNNLNTNLTASLSPSAGTMIVTSTAGLQAGMTATIDVAPNQEIAFITSIVSGTVAAIARNCEAIAGVFPSVGTHSAGVPVVINVTAYSGSNGMKSAIYAIENLLLTGGPSGTINSANQYTCPVYSASPSGTIISGDTACSLTSGAFVTTSGSFGTLQISGITGSTQCLQVDSSGNVTGSGSSCGGGGGGGTVTPSPQYEVASFTTGGVSAVVAGTAGFTFQSGVLTSPHLTLSAITGSTQCLEVNSSGVVSGTGAACGSIASGTAQQVGVYSAANTISGYTGFTYGSSLLTTPGLKIGTLTGCLAATSGTVSATSGAPCPVITSEAQYDVAFYPNTGVTLGGNSSFTFSPTGITPAGTGPTLQANFINGSTALLIANGANVVYRCTTAGVLPAGTLTVTPGGGNCVVQQAIGLWVP